MVFLEMLRTVVSGVLMVVLVVLLGALVVLLGVLPFVVSPKVLDMRSSYVPFVHIHSSRNLRISTFHYGVYRKFYKLGNWVVCT